MEREKGEENRFPGYVLVEMVMTDEAWFVVQKYTKRYRICRISTGTDQNQHHYWNKKFVISLSFYGTKLYKEFDIDVEVGQTVRIIDGALQTYTGKITGLITIKWKMIISMFGNDTQFCEVKPKPNCNYNP